MIHNLQLKTKKSPRNMDVYEPSDKGFSSPTPIRPAIPKFSPSDAGQTNENDLYHDKMGAKLQNPKIPTTKHFMSPTISAASKAIVPRKKILAERNEASTFSDTHLTQTPNHGTKTTTLSSGVYRSDSSFSRVTPPGSCPSDSDSDGQNNFVGNSSLKPYDPLTNYLSPRPKFLRYKPNRCREIFLCKGSEIKEGKDGVGVKRSVSFDSQKVVAEEDSSEDAMNSSFSSEEGFFKQDDDTNDNNKDENHEEDEEIEEIEERACSLKGVLKFLLVLVVLFLSTLHISSMNSPTPLASQLMPWDLKNGYQNIQNHVFEAVTVKFFEGRNKSMDQNVEKQIGLFGVKLGDIHDGFKEQKASKDGGRGLEEVVELQNGDSEDAIHREFYKTQKVCDHLKSKPTAESDDDHILETNAEVFNQLEGAENTESEGVADHELEKRRGSSERMKGTEATKSEGVEDHEIEDIGQRSDSLLEPESVESSESFRGHLKPRKFDWVDHLDRAIEVASASVNEEHGDSNPEDVLIESEDRIEPVEGIYDGSEKKVAENGMERPEDITSNAGDEIVSARVTERKIPEPDISIFEREGNSMEVLVKPGEIKSVSPVLIGLSIFLSMLASLGFIQHSKQKKTFVRNSQPTEKPVAKYVTADKITPIFSTVEEPLIAEKITPSLPNVEEENIGMVKSFANPRSSVLSKEEASKEYSHSHAPSVELLGELVIGEVSSSFRYDRRSKMIQTEESNITVSREEEGPWIRADVVPSEAQPSELEVSTMDSPSYGSFTAEKKIVKKEEGKGGEVKKVLLTTPVRRSGRIRNRAVISP
ncbi:unnamed protein product [Ilex paraguariensis]|uniref:Uncharacterized protein n=1 Tax=Ilex paraguariensis TaxID=185542 RepID=A0ABC8TYQ7_9AQUA